MPSSLFSQHAHCCNPRLIEPWKIKIHERLKVLLWRIVVGATRKHRCSAGAAAPAPDAHWCGDAADMHPCHFFFFFFFFCWVLIRASLWRTGPILAEMADTTRFRPKWAATMSPASILLLHGALCEREREREIRVLASCALTWNYDRESKVENCGVDRFLNRCIGIRGNLWKQ